MPGIYFAPVFIPSTPQKSDQTIIYEQSIQYSTVELERKAFEDGALYWKHRTDSDPTGLQVILFILTFLYFIGTVTTFLIGAMAWNDYGTGPVSVKWDTKFKILFPSYNVGLLTGRFLFQKDEK